MSLVNDAMEGMGTIGCALLLVIGVIFGTGALWVTYINTFGVAESNAQRQVTTHTQQYVQTHQQVLVNLYSDWLAAPDATHKQASALRICAEAAMLDPNEYPAQVQPFIASNCH